MNNFPMCHHDVCWMKFFRNLINGRVFLRCQELYPIHENDGTPVIILIRSIQPLLTHGKFIVLSFIDTARK